MSQVVIENPILNSPFAEPSQHFKFADEGITNEIVETRRVSAYFVPIPKPKKKGKQLQFDTEWTQDRVEENKFANRVRARVALWRQGKYLGVTKTTARLLEHWRNPDREHKLFFCQIEAVETAIYIAEVAKKYGDAWIENELQQFNADANPQLFRFAFKMATGSGKTVVMAMLITWHVLNKLADPQDTRFSDTFLIVTPGITIRDRLRVLLPSDPDNYYRKWELIPTELWGEMGKAKVLITNFHAFKLRERGDAARLTKVILTQGKPHVFTETPDQMVRRVCRDLGTKKNVMVINDEAHHCYRRRAQDEEAITLTGEERKEAEKREEEARAKGQTPPVFIVVCNNTNVSKLVFDYVAGWEKTLPDGSTVVVPGQLPIFSNEEGGTWSSRPNTVLIDSEQLESGEAMSPEFKKIASREIEEFKADYRTRFPGRDPEDLTDEDLLREVMNTIGKPGKLGEQIKCVVSVSMLTEGWDANTVTHILGVRAFGTQLLCEQVVGRGLRRMSYATDARDFFEPEYAEIYGVPFSFIPCSGSTTDPKPPPRHTRVRALEDRIACEMTFPRFVGYRYELPSDRLSASFTHESKLALSTADIPTKVQLDPIVGESSEHTLDDLKRRREQEVTFLLAKLVLERFFRDDEGSVKPWLFPQLLPIARRWLQECVTLKDGTFPQLLLLIEFAHDAADRIYKSIVQSNDGEKRLRPILRRYDSVGSTRYVDFDTAKDTYQTRPDKCHISHVVADTESWEQKMAQALEDMNEVTCYVKNQHLGFTIPYTLNGEERPYFPDFLVRLRDGKEGSLNLIIEVSGEPKKDKAAKVSTARTLWVPAINNHGEFGRWAFLEITDPWDAKNAIQASLQKGTTS